MKTRTVEDLMIPLSDYATVSEKATLYEAVLALEKARPSADPSRHPHRAVIVLGEKGHVVGKIGQTDVLRSLDPKYETLLGKPGPHRYDQGFHTLPV